MYPLPFIFAVLLYDNSCIYLFAHVTCHQLLLIFRKVSCYYKLASLVSLAHYHSCLHIHFIHVPNIYIFARRDPVYIILPLSLLLQTPRTGSCPHFALYDPRYWLMGALFSVGEPCSLRMVTASFYYHMPRCTINSLTWRATLSLLSVSTYSLVFVASKIKSRLTSQPSAIHENIIR